jgi:hypothetical protein
VDTSEHRVVERSAQQLPPQRRRRAVTGHDLFREFSHENFGYFLEFLPVLGPVHRVVMVRAG